MKGFEFRTEQLVRIGTSLVADELARRFGKYTETLTLSRWGAETPLGRGGVEATHQEQLACAERFGLFFGKPPETLNVGNSDTFGIWAERLLPHVCAELVHFRFHPATPAQDVDTRHNADDIFQDAAAVASLMQGRRRVVSLVASHSLLGLTSTVIAPNLQQIDVVDGRNLSPDELADRLSFGDIVVATPTLWRYLADTLPGMANNVMGLSFGERLNTELAGRLRQRGLGALRELYGSTETGVLAWRDGPPAPFVLFNHWSRDGQSVARHRANGQRTPIMPMDDLNWESDRGFTLGVRRDGAVQIGAVNVFPSAIAALIAEHPDVVSCTVRVSQRAGALDRLIAEIKLEPGLLPDQDMAWSIDEWCRERLRPSERPRIYTFHPSASERSGPS
jgi:4-coumarate--CoA ligase